MPPLERKLSRQISFLVASDLMLRKEAKHLLRRPALQHQELQTLSTRRRLEELMVLSLFDFRLISSSSDTPSSRQSHAMRTDRSFQRINLSSKASAKHYAGRKQISGILQHRPRAVRLSLKRALEVEGAGPWARNAETNGSPRVPFYEPLHDISSEVSRRDASG